MRIISLGPSLFELALEVFEQRLVTVRSTSAFTARYSCVHGLRSNSLDEGALIAPDVPLHGPPADGLEDAFDEVHAPKPSSRPRSSSRPQRQPTNHHESPLGVFVFSPAPLVDALKVV